VRSCSKDVFEQSEEISAHIVMSRRFFRSATQPYHVLECLSST
jgi:hypothetical protein